ncbi:MAG: hypothetical protein ACREHG_01335 [Candidatus Saccharimonadales bacterium]
MKFIAEDDSLTIKLEGSEIILGLKKKLLLPRKSIADLRWTAEFNDPDMVLRVVGAAIPRLIYAGHFRDLTSNQNLFLYVRKPTGLTIKGGFGGENVLIITLKNFNYGQVIINCEPLIGKQLVGWWRRG